MNRQDMALSGLNPATQALSGNDLILLTQNTPNGLQSVSATLAQLLQYLFFGSGETDGAIANLGYLKEVTTGNLLEGNGKTNNPLNIKLSPGAGNLLQSRSDGLYYGIGASSDEAITNLGYLKQVYILNPNSGLIGDGRSSNPMSVNFSYLDTLYVNETDFTNYQNNVNTRFDNVNTQINNINNSISQGVVPNSRNVNTGAGLVGGGNLSADRTISMGVPSSITSGSSNSASGDTHSHELAPGAVTNTKLANNSVTDEKIQSVSASKITGVIPSGNLPPAAAPVNVVDNLTSNSANDALSANQGRVLDQNKLNKSGGTVDGDVTINGILTVLANIAALTLKSNVGGTEIETLFGRLTLTNIPNGGGISQVFNTTADRYQFDKPIYAPNIGSRTSWIAVTSSRQLNTTYSNPYDRDLHVLISIQDNLGKSPLTINVQGTVILDISDFGAGGTYPIFFTVPAFQFYSVDSPANGVNTIRCWSERS